MYEHVPAVPPPNLVLDGLCVFLSPSKLRINQKSQLIDSPSSKWPDATWASCPMEVGRIYSLPNGWSILGVFFVGMAVGRAEVDFQMNNHLVKELAGPPRETGTKVLRFFRGIGLISMD